MGTFFLLGTGPAATMVRTEVPIIERISLRHSQHPRHQYFGKVRQFVAHGVTDLTSVVECSVLDDSVL